MATPLYDPPRTAKIGFRADPKLKEVVVEAAYQQRTSVSEMLHELLTKTYGGQGDG